MNLKYVLLLTSLILIGCDNKMPASSEQSTIQIHTEVGILNKLISIPAEPLSVKWEINESKERGTGSLRALLEFNEQDKQDILQKSTEFENKTNDRIDAAFFDTWLPAESKEGIETELVSGSYLLKDTFALQPDLFTQTELSPYVNGSITPLSGGYILIALYSM